MAIIIVKPDAIEQAILLSYGRFIDEGEKTAFTVLNTVIEHDGVLVPSFIRWDWELDAAEDGSPQITKGKATIPNDEVCNFELAPDGKKYIITCGDEFTLHVDRKGTVTRDGVEVDVSVPGFYEGAVSQLDLTSDLCAYYFILANIKVLSDEEVFISGGTAFSVVE